MPIYTYECECCGETVEYDLSIADRDSMLGTTCPMEYCGCDVVRIVDGGNFQLKGRGWARDGYATVLGDTPGFNKGSD